jgi:hypothetical protein
MSLLREIQNDLSRTEVDVPIVLRKCKILAARLGSKEFSQWIEWELNAILTIKRHQTIDISMPAALQTL